MTANATSANEVRLDSRSSRPVPPKSERKAQDEQQIPDDAAGERAAHDLGQSLVDGDQRDDQLGRVSERRVQEAADAGPGVV